MWDNGERLWLGALRLLYCDLEYREGREGGGGVGCGTRSSVAVVEECTLINAEELMWNTYNGFRFVSVFCQRYTAKLHQNQHISLLLLSFFLLLPPSPASPFFFS